MAIRDFILGRLTDGTSRFTVHEWLKEIKNFYKWCDSIQEDLKSENAVVLYLEWTASLSEKIHLTRASIRTAYDKAHKVGLVLDDALELETSLIRQSRLRKPRGKLIATLDKQNLEDTLKFGIALTDVCNQLTGEVIRGKLPVIIKFRGGKTVEEWARLIPSDRLKAFSQTTVASKLAKVKKARDLWESDTSLRTRKSIANIRIEAELLIFIAQTGMNLSQVQNLRVGQFSYSSHANGYLVSRVYKGRKGGEVHFPIYSEYRPFFERYLSWLKAMALYVEEGRLFPLISMGAVHSVPAFRSTKRICSKLDLRFIGPASLRKSRINWLARQTGSVELTAEMAQHSRQTLLRNYLQPNHQIAVAEITRFHHRTDPTYAPPAPGLCISVSPVPEVGVHENTPKPDCISPAGCMFCVHHRDIDSSDHVWSLMSYRQLKILELSAYRPSADSLQIHPARLVIERITEKLASFGSDNELQNSWLIEGAARIEEGHFHPMWDGFLQLAGA
jgi:hypothetical protein